MFLNSPHGFTSHSNFTLIRIRAEIDTLTPFKNKWEADLLDPAG